MPLMQLGFVNIYTFRSYDRDGALLWTAETPNIVVTQGLNDVLTQYFKGSAYTAAWFVGLINNASFGGIAATDTAAKITTSAPSGITNQWKEVSPEYSETTRPTLSLGSVAAGSINNSLALATYTVTVPFTLKGGFVISNSTKGGSSGKLYGAAALATPQTVAAGALTVQVTLTAVTA